MFTYYNMHPSIKSPRCLQRQTRSMTQRYETQDANAEDCHIKNACKKRPYSARTSPEPPSATQDSKIQNSTQRKSQRLAERQQTLASDNKHSPHRQMNSRPSPRGKSANDHQNTNYIMMAYRTVQYNPLTLKIGQPLFGTAKRFVLRELSITYLMLLTVCINMKLILTQKA